MKDYLVTVDNQIFIVLAKNAKDAINQVFENVFEPRNHFLREENKLMGYKMNHIYAKSELSARSLMSIHNEEGKIISL